MLDDFDVGDNTENADDWIDEQPVIECTSKSTSKFSEAVIFEVNPLYFPNDIDSVSFTETNM
jgi:hypothetical protein